MEREMSELSAKLRKYVQEADLDGVEDDVQKAADALDAKDANIAELVEALTGARWYVDAYDNRKHNTDQDAMLVLIDAALSKASQDKGPTA